MILLEEWAKKLHMRPNIMARNALMYSLEKDDPLKSLAIEYSLTGGKEMNTSTLFGDNQDIYLMLIVEKYGRKLTDNEMAIAINYHVDRAMKEELFLDLISGV